MLYDVLAKWLGQINSLRVGNNSKTTCVVCVRVYRNNEVHLPIIFHVSSITMFSDRPIGIEHNVVVYSHTAKGQFVYLSSQKPRQRCWLITVSLVDQISPDGGLCVPECGTIHCLMSEA